MKDNILIVIGFIGVAFLLSCSSPANGETVYEETDCHTEQMNLNELNRRLAIDSTDWEREMNNVDLQAVKEWVDANCN